MEVRIVYSMNGNVAGLVIIGGIGVCVELWVDHGEVVEYNVLGCRF